MSVLEAVHSCVPHTVDTNPMRRVDPDSPSLLSSQIQEGVAVGVGGKSPPQR